MAEKVITIRVYDEIDGWINIFPSTKATLVIMENNDTVQQAIEELKIICA